MSLIKLLLGIFTNSNMNNLNNIFDLTFIILVRLDTIERLENTLVVTDYLTSVFNSNVLVYECASCNNGLLEKLLNKKIKFFFKEDNDSILYRTKFLNQMVQLAETPFITIWDTDVIAPPVQVVKAVELLRNNEADFVYPYDKYFLDTSPILRRMYLQEGKIELLEQNLKKMKEMYPPNPLGGAFIAKLESYKESGLENENFYGWGLEDGERFYRWESLGYKIKRVPGPLFHLSHGRGLNSNFHDVDQHLLKRKEILNAVRKKALPGNTFRIN